MAIQIYKAKDLFHWLSTGADMVVLDVRSPKDFARFRVEGPRPFTLVNISYYDFMEDEEDAVARVPRNRAVRIVCAKENSARYVAEILDRHGFDQIGYLQNGISSWGNLLVLRRIGGGTDYELFQFIRPGKASCSYGLISGKEMMLFDPSRNLDFYLEFAVHQGCMVTKTFETHLQADYIAGSRNIARQTGATFYANDGDFKDSNNPYTPLQDGEIQRFSLGGPDVRVVFTPGHTPGSTSYLIDERFLLSGDTIFIDSVGRPDLGGQAEEWAMMLYETIQSIKGFDPELQVLPGHYIDWREADENLVFARSLGRVLERNRAIYEIDNPAAFIAFIKENMRPQPEEYAIIRLVNANLREEEQERQEELDLGKNECAASGDTKAWESRNA
ncbi:MAG: MBL fold metallo-hydrolase [Desulfobulbus sp.]|nr:MBL fold metallo-hydrolase [Desulfobulbus sp.]